MSYVPAAQRFGKYQKPLLGWNYCSPKRCLLCLSAVLMSLVAVFWFLLYVRHAYSDFHIRTDTDGELVIVQQSIALTHKAVCLDGSSSPGFYMRTGTDEGENKWLMVIPHSSWCTTPQACYNHSLRPLAGSMTGAPVTQRLDTILTTSHGENSYFSDWNIVMLVACDGIGFLGNRSEIFTFKDAALHSRGASCLTAILDHVKQFTGFAAAEEVVLYGEDSGATSALTYAEFIKSQLRNDVKFTTIARNGLLFGAAAAVTALHGLSSNTLLSGCDVGTDCLSVIQLTSSLRSRSLLLTSLFPLWSLEMMYSCVQEQCLETIYAKEYAERISALAVSLMNSSVSLIATVCELPLGSSPLLTEGTPFKSVYKLVLRWLMLPSIRELIVETADAEQALLWRKSSCRVAAVRHMA